MPHIWTFSPNSQVLLQQCLRAAPIADDTNPWVQQFGPKNLSLVKKEDDIIINCGLLDTKIEIKKENQDDEILSALEEFKDKDFDVISNFDTLEEKCLMYPTFLRKLVEKLSVHTSEKITQYVFDTQNISSQFLEQFFEYFLPAYIKQDKSRTSTDLLLKTFKLFLQYFKVVLGVVIKDLGIQNNIVHDFILILNSNELTEFLNIISSIELSGEEFSHNLFNIFTAYKNCNKTDGIQKYIFSVLNSHSQFCSIDKNYGKLLLAYLQQEKNSKLEVDNLAIERIVESHKSAFKRPCLAVLKEINNS